MRDNTSQQVPSSSDGAFEGTLQVLRVIHGTSVDGPHLRTSIYLAGCNHACPGCHNPQSWSPRGGDAVTPRALVDTIAREELPVTLSGGDPLYQAEGVACLTTLIKQELGYNIWLYTGYTWEQIIADERLLNAVRHVDVVVDGPFVMSLRDTDLLFRGSGNQRIIDVPASLAAGSAVTIADPRTL